MNMFANITKFTGSMGFKIFETGLNLAAAVTGDKDIKNISKGLGAFKSATGSLDNLTGAKPPAANETPPVKELPDWDKQIQVADNTTGNSGTNSVV